MAQNYDANAYTVRAATGVLAATLAAGATVFSMRNTGTKIAYIDRVVAAFGCTVAFTAGSQLLFVLERFTAATPTGGTAYTPFKHSTGQGTSTVTDTRASTTAALTVTSVTFEGNQIPLFGFASPAVSFNNPAIYLDYNNDPIRLATGEGLAIRNVNIWPAAGTGVVTAMVSWVDQ